MWQRPCRAQPGPLRLAIQWALLSSLSSLSILPATSRLLAASLACGVITPTLEMRHWACALTIVVLKSLLYWLVMTLNCSRTAEVLHFALSADLNQRMEIL